MANFIKAPCEESAIRAMPPATNAPHVGLWVLIATILGSSMAFIDGSVVNVALPVIQRDLNATATDVQWIVEAYSLFLASLILVGGSLGDLFGRRRVFTIGVALFVVASFICGIASNILVLIISRAIQGVGGALLVPGSLAIISASFSVEQRGRAIGTWSGFTAITSIIGPVLGGVFVQYISWRGVFFLNIPLAIIVLIIAFWKVPESRNEQSSGHIDWWGTLLVTLGLGLVVYSLIEAGSSGFGNPTILAGLIIGMIALVSFFFVEAHSPAPIVSLRLFRSPTFCGANILTFLLYGAMGSMSYFLPFNLIRVQGYPPTFAGAAFVPFILIMFLLSRWAGGLVHRYGAKLPLVLGPLITAVGFALYALPGISNGAGDYWFTFFPAIVVQGLGMTITVAPLSTAIMGAVEQRNAGAASGINNAVSRTASLLAIAILGIVVLAVFTNTLDHGLATLNVSSSVRQLIDAQNTRLTGITIPTSNVSQATQAALKGTVDQAFISSFRVVALICSGLAIASALSAWFLVEGKTSKATNNMLQKKEEHVS
jgi:EmrB/QacA subfamily drug resistance transporter